MLKKLLAVIFIFSGTNASFAQRVQRIEGVIVDKESKMPLTGVTVAVTDTKPPIGTTTDINGKYRLENIPVGKHNVTVSYLGYQSITIPDVLVTSAKEVVLPIELEESAVSIKEVTVSDRREHINDMALISAKTFDVQETERYAGSRADPARMASNFAGVQGGDDSRNDIIIRGNSPQGVLWRLEGMDIPNPNHFDIPGTTGGPVTMLNSKTLANSDFFTGAFPAEYGDAVAGVFDVKLRNGNPDRYEFTGQFGFLGTELDGEGPISQKDGSSFLFTYRYSTLALFEGLHINTGTTSTPYYQDATFKLNFPIGKKSNLAIFGIGGLSNDNIIVSTLAKPSPQLYGEPDRDQYFTSNKAIAGISYSYIINSSTYTRIVVGETGSDIFAHHNYVFRDADYHVDSIKPILGYNYKTTSTVAHWYVNKKLSAKHTLQFGIINNYYHVNLIDSSREYPVTRQDWQNRESYIGGTDLVQAYIQYKYRPTDNLTFTVGLHAQYLTLNNNSKSLEPRAAMRLRMSDNDALSFGYGLHSEMLPLYEYYEHLPQYPVSDMQNENVGFIRSHHLVGGYDHSFSPLWHLHTEAYYQYLFEVPISTAAGSSYSALDQGTGYSRDFEDTLKNTGTGYNYGLEVALEKRFSKGYYFMFTGSLFNSKARGNDGVYRNTDYNSHYVLNLLGGYEKKLGNNSTLITGIKITYQGGMLYSPANARASDSLSEYVVVDSERNTLQFKPYFRTDIKLGVRINAKKVTHELAIDLVNVFGTKNILSYDYSSELAVQGNPNPFYVQYQLGFLPIFYYRLDFGFKARK